MTVGAGLAGTAPAATAADAGPRLLHARSLDGGSRFTRGEPLSASAPDFPDVAAQGGTVHVVWSEQVGEVGDVYYRRSDDGGGHFAGTHKLSSAEGKSSEPDVAVDEGMVRVVWEESMTLRGEFDDVFLRRSRDRGSHFGREANASETRRAHDTDPELAADGSNLVIVYETEIAQGNKDIIVRRSGDGGETWGRERNVSPDPADSNEPVVAVAGSVVHVFWQDERSPGSGADDRLAYARSNDGGETFAEPIRLPAGAEQRPAVAVTGDVVHLVGCSRSDPSTSTLFAYRSPDRGRTWTDPKPLTEGPGECHRPSVASVGDGVVVAWEETLPGRESDVLVRTSDDGGRSFHRARNVSESQFESQESAVAIDPTDGSVHVVWIESPPDGPDDPDDPDDPGGARGQAVGTNPERTASSPRLSPSRRSRAASNGIPLTAPPASPPPAGRHPGGERTAAATP